MMMEWLSGNFLWIVKFVGITMVAINTYALVRVVFDRQLLKSREAVLLHAQTSTYKTAARLSDLEDMMAEVMKIKEANTMQLIEIAAKANRMGDRGGYKATAVDRVFSATIGQMPLRDVEDFISSHMRVE